MNNVTTHETSLKLGNFAAISEEFFQMSESEIDYQKICDTFLKVINAKYCILNLYDNEGGSFTSVAISGPRLGIVEASRLFGFNIVNKKWPRDIVREEYIKLNTITKYSMMDLIGSRLSQNNVNHLISLFGLGESFIVKISKGDELLGDFMVIMDKSKNFESFDEATLYTRLLGMLLVQKRTSQKLEVSETKLGDVIEFLPDAIFAVDKNRKVIIWNKAIEEMTGILKSQMIGKDGFQYSVPFYGELRPHLIDLVVNSTKDIENKYTDFKRGANYVSAQTYANKLNGGKGAWLYAKASLLHDKLGNVIGSIEIIRDITEQMQADFQLKNSKEKFENLFKRAPLGYQSLDENGRFIEVNDAWLSTLGYENSEVLGKWFGDFLCDEYVEAFRERFPIFKKLGKIHSEFYMKHKNGEFKYISFEGRIGYKLDGSFEKTHCIIQDLTDKKLADELLIESEQTHKALFDFSGVGIGYYTVDGYIISYNKKAAENMGGKSEDFVGKYIYDVFPKENADVYLGRIIEASRSETPQDYEDLVRLPTGNLWYFSTFSRIFGTNGKVKGVQIISQDISELKNKEEKIAYLSYHDQLTGLYNRRFFDEELSRLDTPRNYPLTIAMGDVNGLKLVNDSFGHKTGDELLISVAKSIQKACRQDDIIARVGGDEFTIILPRTDESDTERIIQRINHFISLEKVGPLDVSISFGYETKHLEAEDINEIVKKTEDHMYRHKINESTSLRNKTINLIMSTLFEKNKREMNHSERVSSLCVEIATALGLGKDDINHIRSAGLMHDIGKIGIDENILNSETILTNNEWKEIKKHPEIGYRILNSAPDFSDIADDVYSHHERWDGKGYPRGIKDESISIFARIISIADSYDAMISERPYRKYQKSLRVEDAINEIRRNAGAQFDPFISRIFVEKVMHFDW